MNLFIYGYGGLGREVASLARRMNKNLNRWERIAFLDDAVEESSEVFRLDRSLREFGPSSMEAVVAIGEPFVRQVLIEKLDSCRVPLATLVDELAVVSESASAGDGAIIFPGCYLSAGVRLGRNVTMIAGALVGHDTIVGENCVLSGHVNLGGGCSVGSNSYLGMGVQVREMTRIGHGAVVGMGSIVFADIPDEVIALGNPCRVLRQNSTKRIFNRER